MPWKHIRGRVTILLILKLSAIHYSFCFYQCALNLKQGKKKSLTYKYMSQSHHVQFCHSGIITAAIHCLCYVMILTRKWTTSGVRSGYFCHWHSYWNLRDKTRPALGTDVRLGPECWELLLPLVPPPVSTVSYWFSNAQSSPKMASRSTSWESENKSSLSVQLFV